MMAEVGLIEKGEREEQGYSGRRSDPRQDAYDLAEEAPCKAIEDVDGGEGNGESHVKVLEKSMSAHFYHPMTPVGSGMVSQWPKT